MFHVPEKYRTKNHPLMSTDESYGNNGCFEIPIDDNITAWVIASDGEGWEHVSIHIHEGGKDETPVWDEMCFIKDMFWDKTYCVIQYHPPEADYVNVHKNTLHLWRPVGVEIPMPPSIMVGVKLV